MNFAAEHGSDIVARIRVGVAGLQAVLLYGSRARGEAWPHSDIDVAVLAKAPVAERELRTIADDLGAELNAVVSVVDARRIPPTLASSLIDDAVPLAVIDATALADWEARSLTAYGLLNYERHSLLKDFWHGQPIGARAWKSA